MKLPAILLLLSFHLFSFGQVAPFIEKGYLHTDRCQYATNEDIWYAAYLVNANSLKITDHSTNLYVELISPASKILSRQVVLLGNGVGHGDFHLADTFEAGTYRLRAYTRYMRNFGETFVFEKQLQVTSKVKAKRTSVKMTETDVQFFPESGSLIDDVPSVVAFKAVDAIGKGVSVTGSIYTSAGVEVTPFASTYQGMGQVAFTPHKGETYYAMGTCSGQAFRRDLSRALATGFLLNTQWTDSLLEVVVQTNEATFVNAEDDEMFFTLSSKGIEGYRKSFDLEKSQMRIGIPRTNLPNGVLRLTLYNRKGIAQCERLLFNENTMGLSLSIKTDKSYYRSRDSVGAKVTLQDALGKPVEGVFSVSVTDTLSVPQQASNIASYLLLESELKGVIENPAPLFDPSNHVRQQQLNLLMLTQGWSNYLWRQKFDSAYRQKIAPEQGIAITGFVRERFRNVPVASALLTYTMLSSKTNKYGSQHLDSLGHFRLEGLQFYGKRKITLHSIDAKGKGTGWILLDSLFTDTLALKKELTMQLDTSQVRSYVSVVRNRQDLLKNYKLSDTVPLNEVKVSAFYSRERQQEIDVTPFGIIDCDIRIKEDEYNNDVTSLLINKVRGATLRFDGQGAPILAFINKEHPNRLISPTYYLNSFPVDIIRVYLMTMEEIERILTVGPHIFIYTKPDYYPVKEEFFNQTKFFQGYYQARTYYSPRYNTLEKIAKPDLRNTIYWKPDLQTNANGVAEFSYFNPDGNTTVRVNVQGITSGGVPLVSEILYHIQ